MISQSEEQTYAAARELAHKLKTPAHILLYGDLGAGKTLFAKGLAKSSGESFGEQGFPSTQVAIKENMRRSFEFMREFPGGRVGLFFGLGNHLSDFPMLSAGTAADRWQPGFLRQVPRRRSRLRGHGGKRPGKDVR